MNNQVTALAQARDGYLWVGTQTGLSRFDGERFKPVGGAGFTNRLEDSNVIALAADPGGNLWIASSSGIITEFSGGTFCVRYRPPEATAAYRIAGGNILMKNWRSLKSIFAVDAQGCMWAITITGELVQFKNPTAPSFASPAEIPEGPMGGLAGDSAGRLWLLKGTNAAVLEDSRWIICTNGPAPHSDKILGAASGGGFWTAWKTSSRAEAYLVQYRMGLWGLDTFPVPVDPFNYPVVALLQDHLGRLWLSLRTEGLFVKSDNQNWVKVQSKGPLNKCTVRCLYEDNAGGIWAGTEGEGLYQIRDSQVQMVLLPPEAENVHVNSVCLGRNREVWMATDRGLYRQGPGSSGLPESIECFRQENIYAVMEDSQTNLWVGARSGLFRASAGGFDRILNSTNGGFLALFEDQSGDVWAGGFNNVLCHFHNGLNDFTCHPPKKKKLAICCLAQDNQGQMLVMTRNGGLWRVDKRKLLPVESAGSEINANGRGTSVICGENGSLWLSSLGSGLFRWSTNQLQQFGIADGLPDDNIFGMAQDRRGTLWMSSRNGIFGCSIKQLDDYARHPGAPLVCRRLDARDGMADRECTGAGQPAVAIGPDGRVGVSTIVGVALFYPDTCNRIGPTPDPLIETLTVDGRVSADELVSVPGDSSHFEFVYADPELATPEKLHFRYRLEGMDQRWTDAGRARTAVYNRLPPGKYEFRVMASGEDGIWHEAKHPFRVDVVPFFWQTWWFQFLMITAAIALVSGIVAATLRRRAQRAMERMEALRAVDQVRQDITRDLHDELGSAITEIMHIGDLTMEPEPGQSELKARLGTITKRVRQLSISVDEIVWTMSSRNDTLRNLLGYLSNHAQEFFRHSGILCRLDVPANLPEVKIDSQKRHNLFMATKEALNNAAKHSGATQVVLRAHFFHPELRITVEDNGRGLKPDGLTGGEGLANMRERMQSMEGSVLFNSPSGGGAAVTFILNLQKPVKSTSGEPGRRNGKSKH